MPYKAEILLDSVNQFDNRLTTFLVQYPRFVHSEHLRHRIMSFSVSSSRAIPNKKLLDAIKNDPVYPVFWGKNQPGMSAEKEIEDIDSANKIWIQARDSVIKYTEELSKLGVHKQIINRLLEPWMFVTVIVSATEWDNFFYLRCAKDAQPEIKKIADMMKEIYDKNEPKYIKYDSWHLPLTTEEDGTIWDRRKISAARCARASYLTMNERHDIISDINLFDKLVSSKHFSPLEHVASSASDKRYGNFFGWRQLRKSFKDEHHGRKLE